MMCRIFLVVSKSLKLLIQTVAVSITDVNLHYDKAVVYFLLVSEVNVLRPGKSQEFEC